MVDLPPVDGCGVCSFEIDFNMTFVFNRRTFMIQFIEWRLEKNELIIAQTSEQCEDIVKAHEKLMEKHVLALNYDDFQKYTFD